MPFNWVVATYRLATLKKASSILLEVEQPLIVEIQDGKLFFWFYFLYLVVYCRVKTEGVVIGFSF